MFAKLEKEEKAAFAASLTALRSQIHSHPELSSQEFETTALVKKTLSQLGLELLELGTSTGAAALLRGGKPGPTVGIRADMDALPVEEASGADCASRNPGVMHACGHDIHITALLGAAKLLSRRRQELCGNVIFLFQPAEETVVGAESVIASGFFERYPMTALICIHVWPQLPLGQVGVRCGAFLSGLDSFKITFTGHGGHGSMLNAVVDPIPAGASLALSASAIANYNLPPLEPATISICSIQAGYCDNVIPDTCVLLGTVRTFSQKSQLTARKCLLTQVEHTAAAYGCTGDMYLDHTLPPVVNSPELARIMGRSADDILGEGTWVKLDPVMISEDFAYYGAKVPTCCALFGVGTEGELHSAFFFPPHDVLVPAALYLARCAEEILKDKAGV